MTVVLHTKLCFNHLAQCVLYYPELPEIMQNYTTRARNLKFKHKIFILSKVYTDEGGLKYM